MLLPRKRGSSLGVRPAPDSGFGRVGWPEDVKTRWSVTAC